MKVFSRAFTLREKLLLMVLCLLRLGVFYVQCVDMPVREGIAAAENERASLETELMVVEAKLDRLEKMENELDRYAVQGQIGIMGSYNNSKAEVKMLNDILEKANTYSIAFTDVTRDGDQVRRNLTLRYTAKNYETAAQIIAQLSNGQYRCLLGNVVCESASGYHNLERGEVTVNLSATFYEPMAGDTVDAGLPIDDNTKV